MASIICGSCKDRHATVADVRDCHTEDALNDLLERQADADYRAELAGERALEDRGYEDARAQEAYEASHGVVSFEDAYREACPWLFV